MFQLFENIIYLPSGILLRPEVSEETLEEPQGGVQAHENCPQTKPSIPLGAGELSTFKQCVDNEICY